MDIFQGRTQRNDIAVPVDGILAPARLGDAFALATMDAHGRYYDAVRRGRVFFVTNSAAQALSTNSTTATGIILFNPLGSGVNLAILEVMIAPTTVPAANSVAVLTGGVQNTIVTQTTTNVANGVTNALITGGQTSKATVGSSATIATANIQRILPLSTAASTSAGTSWPPFSKDETAGVVVLPPGSVTSLQAVTTAITVWGQITWEEIPT